MKRVGSGDLHAIIVAAAGLKRLGLSPKILHIFPVEKFLPAIGQGALGLEMRQDNDRIIDLIGFLNHEPTELAVKAERAFLKRLEGGCQVPIAGHGRVDGQDVIIKGMVAELDGSRIISDEVRGPKDRPEEIGINLAKRLLHAGADKILARIYGRA
jgi:hydroxymethylbilane synthase